MQWQSTGTGVCKSLQSIGNRLHTGTDMCVESTACSGKVQVQVCVNLYSLYTGTEMCVVYSMQWQSTGTGVCKFFTACRGHRLHTSTDICVKSMACSGKVQVQVCVKSSQPIGDTGYIQTLERESLHSAVAKYRYRCVKKSSQPTGDTGYIQTLACESLHSALAEYRYRCV